MAILAYMGNFESTLAFRDAIGLEAALEGYPAPLETAAEAVVDTVYIIGSTGMAVGGLAALILDNTISGSREERGLAQWDRLTEDESDFEPFWERWTGSDREQ